MTQINDERTDAMLHLAMAVQPLNDRKSYVAHGSSPGENRENASRAVRSRMLAPMGRHGCLPPENRNAGEESGPLVSRTRTPAENRNP